MKPLAIVCPSRGRPEALHTMIATALTTSRADVLIYNDVDDLAAYWDSWSHLEYKDRVFTVIGAPVGRVGAVNALAHSFGETYRMFLVTADDCTFTRKGWDAEVIAAMDAFGDDIGCVHLASDNGLPHVNFPCVSRRWIETLGWLECPRLKNFCVDTVIEVLAIALNRITQIAPEAVVHHVVRRDGYQEAARADVYEFLAYITQDFAADLAKLRAVLR